MEYIKNNLLENENIIFVEKPHWIIFSTTVWALIATIYIAYFAPLMIFNTYIYGYWKASHLINLMLVIATLYWFFQALIMYYTSEYGVTTKRVMMKVGLIRRRSLEILIEKVEGISVDQSIVGRLLNYGTITIIGTGGTRDSFLFIPNPMRFRKTVQQQIDDLESARVNKS